MFGKGVDRPDSFAGVGVDNGCNIGLVRDDIIDMEAPSTIREPSGGCTRSKKLPLIERGEIAFVITQKIESGWRSRLWVRGTYPVSSDEACARLFLAVLNTPSAVMVTLGHKKYTGREPSPNQSLQQKSPIRRLLPSGFCGTIEMTDSFLADAQREE